MDNGSGDGTGQDLKSAFPELKLIELPSNIGAVGRSEGIKVANGEFIVTLDNDVYFESNLAAERLVEVFNHFENVACINFKILRNANSPDLASWCHPRDINDYFDKSFETDYISEGACAFRRSAIKKVGYYYPPLFMGHEGEDLALRLLDAGYDILYTPEVEVYHLASMDERPSWRVYYYNTRNNIWVTVKNYDYLYSIKYILFYLAILFFFSFRAGQMSAYFVGVKDGFLGLSRIMEDRKPIKQETILKLKKIHSLRPNIFKRIRKHLKTRII